MRSCNPPGLAATPCALADVHALQTADKPLPRRIKLAPSGSSQTAAWRSTLDVSLRNQKTLEPAGHPKSGSGRLRVE